MPKDMTEGRAVLYRRAIGQSVCPHGLKARHLLRREGLEVEERLITTPEQNEAVKAELGVKTTPQVFLGGERIGGYDDLRTRFGKTVPDPNAVTYRPVLTIFAVAALMALAVSWLVHGTLTAQVVPWFVAISMCFLGVQKLQDVDRFATMFLNYDLLARRWVPYGYVYPFVETAAGVLMLAGVMTWLAVPAMLFIGTVGAVSVFKAVYIDKRELKCACVGGNTRVPLGFVSLTENLAMMAMGLWGMTQLL
ncbi:MauE/DoxX family redox-associated membrane protein [Jannaschia sp. M317]|uniref:glutaredoxin family protein n=1 Tax=Jannaschia sp. M317 TaxID=2867011 RepID=UPI0021A2FDC0|nr:MauE/DoxX family redox-associated membrane protein [Jannaschia sp. M317]UWQ18574.1 glutaredoxin [Jannaschia sp. M317]